jgi:hypothetical protein
MLYHQQITEECNLVKQK